MHTFSAARDDRLVKLLAEEGFRQGDIRRALKLRDVLIDGLRASADCAVRGGSVIQVRGAAPHPRFSVLFEDERLMAVEKLPGLPVNQDDGATLEKVLAGRARPVHRLDAMTGGIVLCAKDQGTEKELLAAFAGADVQKTYLCVTRGVPPEGKKVHYLLKDEKAARVAAYPSERPGALKAELAIRLVRAFADLSLCEIDLFTGRTHQIRAQLARLGHPVLGDDKYGDRQFNRLHHAKYQQLWAVRLICGPHRFISTPRFTPLLPQEIKDAIGAYMKRAAESV